MLKSKRDLYFDIEDNVRKLQNEYFGEAPLNILLYELRDKYAEKEIKIAIDELIAHGNIRKTIDKAYLKTNY